MDGGSVYLEATDTTGRLWQIALDWSIAARRAGETCLSIDGVKLRARSAEEADWIESLRCAHIAVTDNTSAPQPSVQERIVLPTDAKTYLKAVDQDPGSALTALRDDLLQKLQSPQHGRQPPASSESRRSGRLPLP